MAPPRAVLEVEEAGTGAAAGFALPEIPILPVRESNNPPTDGETLTTTSGSGVSPATTSPTACATIKALCIQKDTSQYFLCMCHMMVNERY